MDLRDIVLVYKGEIVKEGYHVVSDTKKIGDYYRKSGVYHHEEMINDNVSLTPFLNVLTKFMFRDSNEVIFDGKRFCKSDVSETLGISNDIFRSRLRYEVANMTITKLNKITYMVNPNYLTKCYGKARIGLVYKWNGVLAEKVKTQSQKNILDKRFQTRLKKESNKKLRLLNKKVG